MKRVLIIGLVLFFCVSVGFADRNELKPINPKTDFKVIDDSHVYEVIDNMQTKSSNDNEEITS